MKQTLSLLTFTFLISVNVIAQNIDSLKLSASEIPKEYSVSKENNCISIQACTFYKNPDMYEMFIGKVKNKNFQSFDSKNDKGSIMYFEFEKPFEGGGFLGGLLWGGDKPTKDHPEEFFIKGNFLIIWSFYKGSAIKKISEDKVKKILK